MKSKAFMIAAMAASMCGLATFAEVMAPMNWVSGKLLEKQDALPYPTNAIPADAVSGAPWALAGDLSQKQDTLPYPTNAIPIAVIDGSDAALQGVYQNAVGYADLQDDLTLDAAKLYADSVGQVLTVTNTPPAYSSNDVWYCNWNGEVLRLYEVSSRDTSWANDGCDVILNYVSGSRSGWYLYGVASNALQYSRSDAVATLNFGTVGGVKYTMKRYGSYDERWNPILVAANKYAEESIAQSLPKGVHTEPVDIPPGCTEVDKHGCVHNAPVELGLGAKASVELDGLINATCRVVSVAIGVGADATNPDNLASQQGIAIGPYSRAKGPNAMALGAGVRHEDEDDLSGDNAYAGAGEAIAGGYSAKATASKAVAWGSRARSQAEGAWQLGEGVNSNRNTLAFRAYQILGEDGQIPYERLSAAVAQAGEEFEAAVSKTVKRILSGGNMLVVGDGSEQEQFLEPVVGGLSELSFQTWTNGLWVAETEVGVLPPPVGARNCNVLVNEIPIPWYYSPASNAWFKVDEGNRFIADFSQLPPQYSCEIYVDPSRGFVRVPGKSVSITNAPTVIKMRETSTNRVVVAVKAWSLEDL